MNLTEKLTGIVRTIAAKVRLDEDMPKSESKAVFLDIDFSDCSIEDVLSFACADRKIAWANGGSGRKLYSSLITGQHIKVKAVAPGRAPQVDPITAVIQLAAAAGLPVDEYMKREAAKRVPPSVEPLK